MNMQVFAKLERRKIEGATWQPSSSNFFAWSVYLSRNGQHLSTSQASFNGLMVFMSNPSAFFGTKVRKFGTTKT